MTENEKLIEVLTKPIVGMNARTAGEVFHIMADRIRFRLSSPPQPQMIGGFALISAERERQIAKGYDASHDDEHNGGEIIMSDWGARARIEAAINAGRSGDGPAYKELLAEAAAQCVAEIDRVERMEGKANA